MYQLYRYLMPLIILIICTKIFLFLSGDPITFCYVSKLKYGEVYAFFKVALMPIVWLIVTQRLYYAIESKESLRTHLLLYSLCFILYFIMVGMYFTNHYGRYSCTHDRPSIGNISYN